MLAATYTPFQIGLVRVLSRIEQYDPKTDYLQMMADAESIWSWLGALKNFYIDNESNIIGLAQTDIRKFYDIFSFNFDLVFSPIEKLAWNAIRWERIVLYPQYPVLNFFIDFANPYLKIGLELDGKEFHNKERDLIRDEKLLAEGWKIFRVTGAECLRWVRKPILNNSLYINAERGLKEYFFNTLCGVVEAINQIYFWANKNCYTPEDDFIYDTCIETLDLHKLANFKIHG